MYTQYIEPHNIKTRKITAYLPEYLLEQAQCETGKGITETLKAGLEKLALAKAYENVRKLRGKVKFSIDINESREDRY